MKLRLHHFPPALYTLLHLALWCVFLALPFLLKPPTLPPDTPRVTVPSEVLLLLNMLSIPLYYWNAYVLIPRVLRQRGVAVYITVMLLSVLAVVGLNLALRVFVLFPDVPQLQRVTTFTLFPILLVLAASTLFRFLNDFMQEQAQRSRLENERLRAELSFLRSQISPHFMFNVLNSIVSLARKKSDLVEPAILQLSDLMRYMLYESDDRRVTLAKEIKYLNSYIDLQRLRFGDDINLQFSVDNQLPHQLLEPMLLIPFVENAFKHGVGAVEDPLIEVSLRARGNRLDFRVVNKTDPAPPRITGQGIGLPNVQRRLNLLYPSTHQLRFSRGAGRYEVLLTLYFQETALPHPARPEPSLTSA